MFLSRAFLQPNVQEFRERKQANDMSQRLLLTVYNAPLDSLMMSQTSNFERGKTFITRSITQPELSFQHLQKPKFQLKFIENIQKTAD